MYDDKSIDTPLNRKSTGIQDSEGIKRQERLIKENFAHRTKRRTKERAEGKL